MGKIELYSEDINYKLYHGSMLDMLEVIEPNTIDSIVTDPPYELNFMGKGWDNAGISFNKDTWKKCFEVLRPGGYLLAFGGSRTFHRIAVAIEDAGFEIRDTIMWLYGSGFPKSMNIGKMYDKKIGNERQKIKKPVSYPDSDCWGIPNPTTVKKPTSYKIETDKVNAGPGYRWGTIGFSRWEGWGTALKPSFEPIIVARKPFKGSLVDNVIKYGVGGMNIDECRVGNEELHNSYAGNKNTGFTAGDERDEKGKGMFAGNKVGETIVNGRFPANTILTYDETPSDERLRYFYCAKASKKDRNEGLDEFKEKTSGELTNRKENIAGISAYTVNRTPRKNTHPTVKPTELMQYLVRLVSPKGATILDCFNGSGSTGKAVMYENKERNADYKYIGIELTEEYLPIAKARIDYVKNEMK